MSQKNRENREKLEKLIIFIKSRKNLLPRDAKSNIVYKIACNNCEVTYVNQTGRQFKIKISEHRNHIERNTFTRLVITDHRTQEGHEFEWKNIILDEELYYTKRLISEMLFIKQKV